VRLFWFVVLALEAAVLTGFVVLAARSEYFTRMPESVRHGATVASLVQQRALWLALIVGVVNAAVLCWIRGVELSRANERGAGVLSMAAAAALFLAAGVAFFAFVMFGFAQY
jgi:predicted small integral membrane protein